MIFSKVAKFVLWCLCGALGLSGCAEIKELQKKTSSLYYGELTPATNNEFRWANGELPKTFDPALAQSPSETQAVRAAFEGLTEWHQQTLEAVPALAVRWESSEDQRTWTFHLRSATWSNGKRATAQDFVRAWRRLKNFGAKSPHQQLISNIVGATEIQSPKSKVPSSNDEADQISNENLSVENLNLENLQVENQNDVGQKTTKEKQAENQAENPNAIQTETWFGVQAIDQQTLQVYLVMPDKDFPKLAAHPALRPIFGDGDEFKQPELAAKIVTNGAFRFGSSDKNGVLLERSKNYWNVAAVKLERLRFVPTENAETALAAYRAGSVDAVTNAHFEPLALKFLASYKDFERTTYNAVTFYEFNQTRAPFADRRVREALTIALDRERLANDELDGAMSPARTFLPNSNAAGFKFDVKRAQTLFSAAGFLDGKDFPKIKLLINRNDASQRLAKACAVQWKKNLNVETEIVISGLDDLENTESTKDFDLVRRVAVLPTTNEVANLQAMFGKREIVKLPIKNTAAPSLKSDQSVDPTPTPNGFPIPLSTPVEPIEDAPPIGALSKPADRNLENAADNLAAAENNQPNQIENLPENQNANQTLGLNQIILPETPLSPVLSETNAFTEIPAIPLYFPCSYSLVKPYIKGFETNLLEAVTLANVEVQTDWQPVPN